MTTQRLADINTPNAWGTIDQVGPLVAVFLKVRRTTVQVGPVYCDSAEEADMAAKAWMEKHGLR